MSFIGKLVAVGGIAVLVWQAIKAVSKTGYHLTRTHDSHVFMVWIIIGVVMIIFGAVLSRQSN